MIRSHALRFIIILVVIIGCIWVAGTIKDSATLLALVSDWGYLGLIVLSIISGFNLVAPVPSVAFIPIVVAAGLNFWIAIAIVIVGMTIGDAIGIFLGKTSRGVLDQWMKGKGASALEKFLQRSRFGPYVLAFLYAAFVPAPNELLLIPLSFLKTDPKKLLVAAFLGNAVFNIILAFGLMGITGLVSGV